MLMMGDGCIDDTWLAAGWKIGASVENTNCFGSTAARPLFVFTEETEMLFDAPSSTCILEKFAISEGDEEDGASLEKTGILLQLEFVGSKGVST